MSCIVAGYVVEKHDDKQCKVTFVLRVDLKVSFSSYFWIFKYLTVLTVGHGTRYRSKIGYFRARFPNYALAQDHGVCVSYEDQ